MVIICVWLTLHDVCRYIKRSVCCLVPVRKCAGLTSCLQFDNLSVWHHFLSALVWLSLLCGNESKTYLLMGWTWYMLNQTSHKQSSEAQLSLALMARADRMERVRRRDPCCCVKEYPTTNFTVNSKYTAKKECCSFDSLLIKAECKVSGKLENLVENVLMLFN